MLTSIDIDEGAPHQQSSAPRKSRRPDDIWTSSQNPAAVPAPPNRRLLLLPSERGHESAPLHKGDEVTLDVDEHHVAAGTFTDVAKASA